jgi:hypothetical protein
MEYTNLEVPLAVPCTTAAISEDLTNLPAISEGLLRDFQAANPTLYVGPATGATVRRIVETSVLESHLRASNSIELKVDIIYEDVGFKSGQPELQYTIRWNAIIDRSTSHLVAAAAGDPALVGGSIVQRAPNQA